MDWLYWVQLGSVYAIPLVGGLIWLLKLDARSHQSARDVARIEEAMKHLPPEWLRTEVSDIKTLVHDIELKLAKRGINGQRDNGD